MSRKRRTVADEAFLIVRSAAANLRNGEIIRAHAHDWHQLIYVSEGVLCVRTDAGSWIAPASWAIWVPARVRHAVRFIGECALRTLYVRPDWRPGLPDRCSVVTVSVLLRELILRITAMGMLDERDMTGAAIATVALEEFRQSDVPPFTLPQPTTEPMRRAADLIVNQAPQAGTIDRLARAVGIRARTLERRFLAETGLSLGRWRRHHGLLRALECLAVGTPIKTVASTAGYANPSAFIAAFRSFFGTTPARYFARP